MPEYARIFWVEDDLDVINGRKPLLEGHGHKVILLATTLEQALEMVPILGQYRINAAIVDRQLSRTDIYGHGGRTIADAIKRSFPDIGIIGNPSKGEVIGADIQFLKINKGSALAKAVTEIPFPFTRAQSA